MSATTRGLKDNYDAIIGTAIAFVVLATGTTALRIAAKLLINAPFKYEDYTLFLAFALYIVTEGLLIRGVTVGRHAETLNDKYNQYYTEFTYIYSVFYFAIMALCIASMILVYRRVFHAKSHIRILAIIVLCVDLAWWISSTIIEIIAPIKYRETFPGNPRQSQLNIYYLDWWLAAGIIEVVMTIIAIAIPISEVRKLRADYRKKILLAAIFSVSSLCVATGIARLATLYRGKSGYFNGRIGNVWINSHLGSAIMSANLPICWPIVSYRKQIVSFLKSGRSSKQDTKSSGSSGTTLPSVISTVELGTAWIGGKTDLTVNDDGSPNYASAVCRAGLYQHDLDTGDIESKGDSGFNNTKEIKDNGWVGARITESTDVKRPLSAHLRPG